MVVEPDKVLGRQLLSEQVALSSTAGAGELGLGFGRSKHETPGEHRETDAANDDGQEQNEVDFVKQDDLLKIGVIEFPGVVAKGPDKSGQA